MQIERFFQTANADNIATLVPQFYREDIQFRDPLVALQGREQLIHHYEKMYEGAEDVQFAFGEHLQEGDSHMLAWTMRVTADKLNEGKPFNVDGVSHIKYADGMVYYHRDYFDLSAMFYEKLPIIGGLVGWLKNRAAHS
ncbi:MAG TPA: nuclear transport factor 2 family protein [Oligoflexus sp.]|uniref:nuclear transport factor 2 family protein n=1 Tax=Oligoflexus sp. TaxID=1971216 RepID=UPI002D5F62CF|nr:nuclear transport factor 2 family protein [Oligoflexus sp.]HYX31699.1 nuclear transport factor 2 family protein [Oligoflexus sp.]